MELRNTTNDFDSKLSELIVQRVGNDAVAGMGMTRCYKIECRNKIEILNKPACAKYLCACV